MITVLDHGFVRLKDSMGSDLSIVEAARVSLGQGSKGPEKDAKLIGYLLDHGHTTPFEHFVAEYHMKIPIFVARQLVRQRTARINEISMRMAELDGEERAAEFYIPSEWRSGVKGNRQSSEANAGLPHEKMSAILQGCSLGGLAGYHALIQLGAAKEMARMALPVNLYTEWYFQLDLNNLLKLFEKRIAPDAQWETQQYARAMLALIEPLVPVTLAAWKERQ